MGKTPAEKAADKSAELKEKEVKQKSVFDILQEIECETETKKDLTYISRAEAWTKLMELYPDSTYHWYENAQWTLWFIDDFGWYAKVDVTIKWVTKTCYLPIMDNANNAMKKEQYTLEKRGKKVVVPAIDSMAINKTYQRAMAKAIAMHGLGLYVYRWEDMPNDEESKVSEKKPATQSTSKQLDNAVNDVAPAELKSNEDLVKEYEKDILDADQKWVLDLNMLKEITKAFWNKYNIQQWTELFTKWTEVFNSYKDALQLKDELTNGDKSSAWDSKAV